jgi:hypothetical protein
VQVLHYRTLIDSLPGHIATLDTQHGGWQMMLIALEWQTGEAGLTLFPLTCGVRPKDALYVGLVINRGWAKLLPALDPIVDMQVHPRRDMQQHASICSSMLRHALTCSSML